MELAFLTPLLKDGADSIGRGIAIDDKGVFKLWLMKDRGHTNSIDKGLEGGLVLIFPVKATSFCAMGHQSIKWCGKHTEVINVHSVEIEEPEKGA